MPIKSFVSSPVLFVRWIEHVAPADMEPIKHAIEAAHAEVGDELVYIAIIPVTVLPPDSEARAALRAGTEHASQHCRSLHVVIEGQGLRRALIRSISAGLLLATRKTTRGFHIHETVDLAIEKAGILDPRREVVMREALEHGMLC